MRRLKDINKTLNRFTCYKLVEEQGGKTPICFQDMIIQQ